MHRMPSKKEFEMMISIYDSQNPDHATIKAHEVPINPPLSLLKPFYPAQGAYY